MAVLSNRKGQESAMLSKLTQTFAGNCPGHFYETFVCLKSKKSEGLTMKGAALARDFEKGLSEEVTFGPRPEA